MLPAISACSIEDVENIWKKRLNDDLGLERNDNTKTLISKFQPRSAEFNDRIRIINVTKLLEMYMDENRKFKIMTTEENKKFLFNISLQIGAMHSISGGLQKRFERISDQNYMKKLWLYMSYLYFPIKNDNIGADFMQKLFDILKNLLIQFPEVLEIILKLEEQRDELINLTKNILSDLLSAYEELGAERIRIKETRLETRHMDSPIINAIKLFSKPVEHITDDPKDVPTTEIENTLSLIKKLKSNIKTIFSKKPFNKNLKEAEFLMGLLYEFDCLKFTYKALVTIKAIKIAATQDFTVTENEIIPILQAVVFLGESMTSAAGIREKGDKDITIIRTLISLRNIVAHKMNRKDLNNYFWNGLLNELNVITNKIKERLDHLQSLFLENDMARLIDKKNEISLDDIIVRKKPNIPINKKNKKLKTEDNEIDELLEKPAWQNHDYKFLRSWSRFLQFRDYNIDDPLIEDIREVAKKFIGLNPIPKPEQPVYTYQSFIKSILENVNKIEQVVKENVIGESLVEKLQVDSEKNDITLFLKLSYFLHQIIQAFKDASESSSSNSDNVRKKKPNTNEIWRDLSYRLDKMGEHRLFEFLYTQIENARNLCIHNLWINEDEYQRFANVIHLILSNLKPMLLRLSCKEPVFLPGVLYFANKLMAKVEKVEKIISNAFFHIRFQARGDAEECDSKMLADYIKQDRELKLYFKLQHLIIQIFNTLQQCQLNNSTLWKRFESEIITLNQQRKLVTIYTNLEFAKNISLRSLWKNNDEYRIFADTVLLIQNKFKPMLLQLKRKKFCKWQKQKTFGRRLNYNIKQQRCVSDQQQQLRKNTANFWWQLLLIKCTVAPFTIKDHSFIIDSEWVIEKAKSIANTSQKTTKLYRYVKKITTKLLRTYFKYQDKGSKKLEQKIMILLKKYKIVSDNGFEENVSILIETFVKQFVECFRNLNELAGWEDVDITLLDTKNLIPSFNKSLYRSKPEINHPGLHNRTPLVYVLGFKDSISNSYTNIYNLLKILINHGADPDKFSSLTLHPLHYISMTAPAFTEWFQEKCVFKNPCDSFFGLNVEMILRNFQSLYPDLKRNIVDDSFFNATSLADRIHYSFPNFDTVDANYSLNLYDQNGKTPLICATDVPYLHNQWKSNLEVIINSGANVNDKEIVSFNNGKPVFGEAALKKVLTVEISGHPWKIEKPPPDLNIRKAVAKYLVSNGADKDAMKYFAANSLFSVIKQKLFLEHEKLLDTLEYRESITNINQITVFWFDTTVLLCDMPHDWAFLKFNHNQFKWINELLFGIKPANIDRNGSHDSMKDSKIEKILEPIENTNEIPTENDTDPHIIAHNIPENQFLLLSNGELMIFDSNNDNLFWQYTFIKSSVAIFKKHSMPLLFAAIYPLIFLKKRHQRKRRHQRWRQRYNGNVCALIQVIIVKNYYQCDKCKEKNIDVIAQLRTASNYQKYLETNQIPHVCKIQDLIKLERVYKQSDCETNINSNGTQELTIVHPTNKQWIFEFDYDENLGAFCCKKCKEYGKTVIAQFWRNRKEEDVVILSSIQHCYKLYEICCQSYFNYSL